MIYLIIILGLFTLIYICSIIWIIFGFLKNKKESERKKVYKIENSISVIIPVRNEQSNILQCLKSFEDQSYDIENFEIIIINDHSSDDTLNLINKFIKSSKLKVELFSLIDKKTKKEALKLGVERANYDIIATTDADCTLPKKWLKFISDKITDEADMLLGPVLFKKGVGLLSGFQTLDMFALQGLEFGTLGHQRPILNNAANLAYSKKSFNEVGGFDRYKTPSGDDVFLLEKFELKGKRVQGFLSNEFIVETEPEGTYYNFFNQRLRWSSKAKYYSNKFLIYFSSIILLENIALLFVYFGIPLVEKYRFYLGILLFSKWLIDFILLFLVADFFKRRNALFYFIPVQIIYPIYIVVIWITSFFLKFEWKERKF